ncbi:hypothetical protein L249_7119 [Ophiocordyceps polyrhachis-furcata BCC 54312]|uniref:Uncharacterized protein n=1 Tax=Ophiocordyceps polyrhachis-furcata BCC 54312 TaxID=1330021 RepID=A0A367LLC8_9HYPO|nr:hypothetical protein L249_7119 [Ophiocordyceps polyrhachis-furcata BCC 54312]
MLIRRLIVFLKKARLAYLILKRTSVPRLPNLPYVPSLVRSVRPVRPLCDVRRPRAGYGRPGVTVSSAPAKAARG